MDNAQVIETLRLLANGINPVNKQPLAQDNPLHDSMVIRTLFRAIEAVESLEGRAEEQTRKMAPLAGKPWGEHEDNRLRQEFHKAIDFVEIARLHDRSKGAIIARLIKLGELRNDVGHRQMPRTDAGANVVK